jgi:3-hydroxyisobutyrate dehydrogenase-like beta-hydroxyacid dehydrogenase
LSNGLASGPIFKNSAHRIPAQDFTPGRPMWLYEKDGVNLAETLAGTSMELPIARQVFERIHQVVESGQGDRDEMVLYTLLDPG